MKQFLLLITFLSSIYIYGQKKVIPLTSDEWTFFERDAKRYEEKNGRNALYLNGKASLKEVVFQDGIIEVDVTSARKRAFAGIFFRALDDGNHETFYLRLHKAGFIDAMQYNPEFNGEANWQLYREHQSFAEFDQNEWNHLKLEIRGSNLKVFLNGSEEAVLEVQNLVRDNERGYIGFYSFLGAYFANFSYTPFPEVQPLLKKQAFDENVIERWDLSQVYVSDATHTNQYPSTYSIPWESCAVEPNGLLLINKYRKKTDAGNFEGNPTNFVWAKHTFQSGGGEVKFSFDFSDDAILFFNGKKLFSGKNSFRAKGPTFRGDLLIDGNIFYLDTKNGNNEILIAVSDKANGWGLMGKLEWEKP